MTPEQSAKLNQVDRIIEKGKKYYTDYPTYTQTVETVNAVYPAATEPTMNKYYMGEIGKIYKVYRL